MNLIWSIALRQLFARKRQALTVIGGVVLGVTVLLVTISLFGGLLDSFTAKIIDVAPHVTMKAESAAGELSDVIVEGADRAPAAVQLEKNSEHEERTRVRNIMTVVRSVQRQLGDVITVASPYLATEALAAYGTNEMTLSVKGVLPSREAQLTDLSKYLRSGSIARLEAARGGMLIGEKAADELGVGFGSRIRLVSLTGDVFNVQIVGVYHLGVEAADRGSYVNLRLAQALDHALPGEASGIGFQLRDVTIASDIAKSIETMTGRKTETWEEANVGIITVFTFLQILFFVVVGFVIIICGFGVANILVTAVLEKQRDIAVMKSFGLTSLQITWIYLLQGVLIALTGSLIGSLVGAAVIIAAGKIPSAGTGGVAPIASETLQMGWHGWYFLVAIASSLLVSIVAAVVPARSAAKVVPIDILRGER